MNKRINLILNGRHELSKVISNLRVLFESEDRVLFYTIYDNDSLKKAFSEELNITEENFINSVDYFDFDEIKLDEFDNSRILKRIIVIKMPKSLFTTISMAYNHAFELVDKLELCEFIHAFTDDCKIISEKYNPSEYEWFMETFEEPFVMDSKTNPGNFAFKKFSPRFVFISARYLNQPISYVQFESKEHFIMNRQKLKLNFDEKLKRLYISEFIMRLFKDGIIKHWSFYPDPILDTWIKRDDTLPFTNDLGKLTEEYGSDEKYLKGELKYEMRIENSVDPIVSELSKIIDIKLKKETDNA